MVGVGILDITGGRWEGLVLWVPFWVWMIIRSCRPPTTLRVDGVHRPWSRRSFVPWSDIESIVPSQPGERFVRLVLTDGSALSLPDVAPQDAAEIAAAGDKPMVKAIPVRTSPTPPRPAVLTERQRAADIDRRIQSLARQRAEMSEQAQRFGRSPGSGQ